MSQLSNTSLNDTILQEFAPDEDATQLLRVLLEGKEYFLRRTLLNDNHRFTRMAKDMAWLESSCLPPRIFWKKNFLLEECIEGQSLREWRSENNHPDHAWVMLQFHHMLSALKCLQHNSLCHGNIALDSCIINKESNCIIWRYSQPCELCPESKKKDFFAILHIFVFILTGKVYQEEAGTKTLNLEDSADYLPKRFIKMMENILDQENSNYDNIELREILDEHLYHSEKDEETEPIKKHKKTKIGSKHHPIPQALKLIIAFIIITISVMITLLILNTNKKPMQTISPIRATGTEQVIEQGSDVLEEQKPSSLPISTFKEQLFDDIPTPILLETDNEDKVKLK